VIVDTHVHVVGDDQARYLLRPSGIGGEWFRESPVNVGQFATLMDESGVERAVLVQAMGAYGFDNDYVLDATATDPARFRSVVIVDAAADPDAAAKTLRALATERGATGVRLFALADGWFADRAADIVWRTAAELDLRVVVTILASQLPALGSVLGRFRDIPVALDHCGFPDLAGGPGFPNAEPLFALAGRANLHLKVSCHVLEELDEPAGFVNRLAAAFGAERLMWGSDFPQTHDRPYAELVDLGRHSASGLSPIDQRAFLGDNACRFHRW
jgi:predicted TIM-barrel fold metal-dependent hydrolase